MHAWITAISTGLQETGEAAVLQGAPLATLDTLLATFGTLPPIYNTIPPYALGI